VNNATGGNGTTPNASAGGGGTEDSLAPAGEGGRGVTLPESEGVNDENEKKMLLMKIGDTACVVTEWVS
jgi:hypothetical protein